jgi:competence ComEA-like helix-hairpin-helix protein
VKQRKINDIAVGGLLLLLLLLLVHALCCILGTRAAVDVRGDKGPKLQCQDGLSAFQKITLGLPISINTENADGLTAIPGIGPKIAASIILERERRGRYISLSDLRLIKGIGPALYRKIAPYLAL